MYLILLICWCPECLLSLHITSNILTNIFHQDELDELERLLLREFAQHEMSAAISKSCQNITNHKMRSRSAEANNIPRTESPSRAAPSSGRTASTFAKKFGQKILNQEKARTRSKKVEKSKSNLLSNMVISMATQIAESQKGDIERSKAAMANTSRIAQACGAPINLNNRRKLLKALVLHISARIITAQKMEIHQAKKERSEAAPRLNNVLRKVMAANRMSKVTSKVASRAKSFRTPSPGRVQNAVNPNKSPIRSGAQSRSRSRVRSENTGMDLSRFAYGESPPRRLYSRPLQPITPEPVPNPNVQRRPISGHAFKSQSGSDSAGEGQVKKATYRFPAIRRYSKRKCPPWPPVKDNDLVDLC